MSIDPTVFRAHFPATVCLTPMNGLDEISLTEQQEPNITEFERTRKMRTPWIRTGLRSTMP